MAADSRTSEKVIALLDMEERLLADEDGSYRKGLAAMLAQLDTATQARMRLLAPPDEHVRLRKLAQGIEAARNVLDACCRRPKRTGGQVPATGN